MNALVLKVTFMFGDVTMACLYHFLNASDMNIITSYPETVSWKNLHLTQKMSWTKFSIANSKAVRKASPWWFDIPIYLDILLPRLKYYFWGSWLFFSLGSLKRITWMWNSVKTASLVLKKYDVIGLCNISGQNVTSKVTWIS